MSVLYCTIPHFAAALARRDRPELSDRPLVLVGPEKRVFGTSAGAAAYGVRSGMTARAAEVHCPEARLLEADLVGCRAEAEALCQVLETASDRVEPHGWGAAYVDMGDGLARNRASAVDLCQEVGRSVRGALGQNLQPALGWNSNKFTAQTAARRTPPGHLRAVDRAGEQIFLQPLPVTLLPLVQDSLQRLQYLGLRTLGQYAALPRAAVWQQFGQVGIMAHRCARGRDDRPVVPRGQAPQYTAEVEFELPLTKRSRLVAALVRLVSPLLAGLRDNLQACGQVRLAVHFDDGSAQERARSFLLPVAGERRVVEALDRLLDGMQLAGTGLSPGGDPGPDPGRRRRAVDALFPGRFSKSGERDAGGGGALLDHSLWHTPFRWQQVATAGAGPAWRTVARVARRLAGGRTAMTRLWPEGELIETPVGAQAHGAPGKANALPAPLQEIFVWRGMAHRITHVCNCWRIDTHWWARLPEGFLDEEPSPPLFEDEKDLQESTNPPSPNLSPKGERRKGLVDVISPTSADPGEPSTPPSGERRKNWSIGTDSLSPTGQPRPAIFSQEEPSTPPSGEGVGEGETYSTSTNPHPPTGRPRQALSPKGERRSVWREYVKVATDTGLLCLLYRDLHDGGWFLARVYD